MRFVMRSGPILRRRLLTRASMADRLSILDDAESSARMRSTESDAGAWRRRSDRTSASPLESNVLDFRAEGCAGEPRYAEGQQVTRTAADGASRAHEEKPHHFVFFFGFLGAAGLRGRVAATSSGS